MDVNYILRQVNNALQGYSEENCTVHADTDEVLVTGEYKGNPLRMHIQEVNKNCIDVRVTYKTRVGTVPQLGLIDKVVAEQARVQPIQVEQATRILLQQVTVE